MGYQLQRDEKMTEGIKRIVIEQIDNILQRLTPPFDNPDVDVHEARKSFKKIRGVLELVQGALPSKTYRFERRFYRDLARQLAGARESYVALQTLESLLDNHKALLGGKRQYAKVRNTLKSDYQEKAARLEQESPFAGIITALETARGRVSNWKFREKGYRLILPGLQQVYSIGATRMNKAYSDVEDIETYHDWRKSVKLLWYHMRILSPTWNEMLTPFIAQLDDLGEILGSEHDHAELMLILTNMPPDRCEPELLAMLLEAIAVERKRLRLKAFLIGQLVYAEDSNSFVQRHRTYWKIWRKPLVRADALVTDVQPT